MWFLCAASVLSLFDISKAVDGDGNVIEPSCVFHSDRTIRYGLRPLDKIRYAYVSFYGVVLQATW